MTQSASVLEGYRRKRFCRERLTSGLITKAGMKFLIDYDPLTGIMSRKDFKRQQHEYKNNPIITINGKEFERAKIAWCLVHGFYPTGEIHHRDGDENNYK